MMWVWGVVVAGLVAGGLGQRPSGLNKRHDVYIAGFFPYGRHVPESHIGRGVMPAVKLAVDHINESPTVLRNYRLHMWWNDTEVRRNYLFPHAYSSFLGLFTHFYL
jgi:gamma-aminobutyric acid type B receptor